MTPDRLSGTMEFDALRAIAATAGNKGWPIRGTTLVALLDRLAAYEAARQDEPSLRSLIHKVEAACPVCHGEGWTTESDPSDETGQTPMQVPCWDAEHAVILNAALAARQDEPSPALRDLLGAAKITGPLNDWAWGYNAGLEHAIRLAANPPQTREAEGAAPVEGDSEFDATAIDYRRGSPQHDPRGPMSMSELRDALTKLEHADGDTCTGLNCANPDHGWLQAEAQRDAEPPSEARREP